MHRVDDEDGDGRVEEEVVGELLPEEVFQVAEDRQVLGLGAEEVAGGDAEEQAFDAREARMSPEEVLRHRRRNSYAGLFDFLSRR